MSKIKDHLIGLSEEGKRQIIGDWKLEKDLQRFSRSLLPDQMDDDSGVEPMVVRFERD